MATQKFRDVFQAEDQIIRGRRSKAGLDLDPSQNESGESATNGQVGSAPFPRTGIALSGGGIRSASFGLGFLQVMYRQGVLRQVDYLSTVSGGSYVGCSLSSSIADHQGPPITLDPSATTRRKASSPSQNGQTTNGQTTNGQTTNGQTTGGQTTDEHSADEHSTNRQTTATSPGEYAPPLQSLLPLLPRKSGAYTDDLKRLSGAGKALNRPLPFFNRLFLGMLLINLTAFSGIITLAALFAIAYDPSLRLR